MTPERCRSCRAALVDGLCPNEWRGNGAPPRGKHSPWRPTEPIKMSEKDRAALLRLSRALNRR